MSTRKTMIPQTALALICAAALSSSLRAGRDYYVDAASGNDLWDGSTAVIPSVEQQRLETVPGPRKTLAGAMAIEGLTSGDTVHAAPGVYNEGGMEENLKWAKMGTLAVEMESTALYLNAARLGKRALVICTISDHLVTGAKTTAEERQNTFTQMMEIALNVAVKLDKE